jgi:hypothetical protein
MKAFLKRVEDRNLTDEDYEIVKGMAETVTFLSHMVRRKKTSILRLLRMLFGAPTEKIKNILKKKDGDKGPPGSGGSCKSETKRCPFGKPA